ncbi:translocation/assembly module TamB domain-containing protein [Aerobium aerolatum]|uniref:Autotransporter secretion inner membrane protein TamB n=1 Tax=Aquamicrobium aerolatum DSM 21857 TaxID=1121003 RepID=A0A1I3QRI4_9HYPH|nr:translocation/assembly module TamB domain-containing protein [Aquamicrobium aerolatum]SFJ35881.1 autotransporter secretion inner membrane protein TamB [Aquamicrobium aerolatum DSM 21857]
MRKFFGLLALFLVGVTAYAVAQNETPEEERGLFLSFIEDNLSAPNRQIRIQNIEGVLSSNARIGLITVADQEGVWLRIENAAIVWSRSALIFSQRLQIDTLSADLIEIVRQPMADESLPAPEAGGFRLPELPIAINLDELNAPRISFGRDVFGLQSELSVTGRIRLEDGSLDTALEVDRLDGPGGQLSLTATYANANEQLELDLSLSEPENGIVANLLNIDGRPPVALQVAGSGPLSALDVNLALDAAGQRILTGATQLRRQSEGLAYSAQFDGPIAQIVPQQFRDFFGAETSLRANGLVKDTGAVLLEALNLQSAVLKLAASAETAPDGFLRRLNLDTTIDNGADNRIILPVPGGETTVGRARAVVAYGEAGNDNWSGQINVEDLATSEFSASRARFDLGGLAQNLDQPAARHLTFAVDGALTGIVAKRADIAEALGDTIKLDVDGAWRTGQPIDLPNAIVSANGLEMSLAGKIAELAFNGDIALRARSLAPFSGLAGRNLEGALDLKATGRVEPLTGAFDLTIDSAADGLQLGIEPADNLLEGHSTITGRVARGETGLVADKLRIGNERVELSADGNFATGTADFDYALVLSDLSLVSPQAAGRLEASGRAAGTDGNIALTTLANLRDGQLVGKRLTDGAITFDGTLQAGDLAGTLGGNAFLDGVRVQLSAGLGIAKGVQRLTDLDFSAGGARATGSLSRGPTGLIDGKIDIAAADISTAAALALLEATGAVNATLDLSSTEAGQQNVNADATIRNLRLGETRLDTADVQAVVHDLFKVPAIDGSVRAHGLVAGGVTINALDATAQSTDGATRFEANADLDQNTKAFAKGSLSPEGNGYRVNLSEASLGQGVVGARLLEAASLLVVGDTVEIDSLIVDVGGGRVSANGRVAQKIDLSVDVSKLPLSIANLVRPDLALGGVVDAQARVTGERSTPDANFTLRGTGITAAALRQAGQSELTVSATGNTSGQRLNLDASVSSPEGLRAAARGGVPLGAGQIAIDVDLGTFPLAALNAVAQGQNLGGTIAGTARVTGTTSAPQATFDLNGQNLSAQPLQAAGIDSLQAVAAGSFSGNAITLSSATINGSQGLGLTANGTIPLSGNGLALSLNGSAPLALANRFLIDRGTQLSGLVELNGSVSGNLQQPVIRGMASTSGAQVVDPETNVQIRDINVMVSMEGETVTIRSANAALASGGSLSASGTVSTNASAGFPADLRVNLNQARYADGDLVVATVNGNLALTGPLARDPLLSGEVNVERAEITVPDNFSGSAAAIDVIHRNAPRAVQETLTRARANDGTPTPTARPSVLRLNVGVNAPARIFVRGRGLDTELGGRLQLTGPVTDIQPVGGFELIRGRLSILGQRITFDEGRVSVVGDLDPYLNFVARSVSGDTTVFITVSGRVSSPTIAFSSQPELPEDEVLARLIFNRGMSELSPMQIAQLAAAAAELAGGSSSSLLGSLRGAAGLDDLDVVTDSEGNAAVRAGRYIQDNIYLGVEAGAQGSTRGTINLDITDDLKARGSIGSNGESSLGVFYERDY